MAKATPEGSSAPQAQRAAAGRPAAVRRGGSEETTERIRRESPEDGGASAVGSWVVRGVIFGALAIAAYVIVPPYLQAQRAQPKWDESLDAFRAGDYDRAIALIDEAKALAPAFKDLQAQYPDQVAEFYLAKGFKLQQDGNDAEAVVAFEKGFEYSPKRSADKGAYFAAAESYRRLKNHAKAISAVKQEIDQNGSQAEIAKNLLQLLLKEIGTAGGDS